MLDILAQSMDLMQLLCCPMAVFLIADLAAWRLLQFNRAGRLLILVELGAMGIKTVSDIRVKRNYVFLLQIFYENYAVHQMTLDYKLIASHKIPHRFPIGEEGLTIENGISGIAIDCE